MSLAMVDQNQGRHDLRATALQPAHKESYRAAKRGSAARRAPAAPPTPAAPTAGARKAKGGKDPKQEEGALAVLEDRVLFNNKSCRLGGAASAARTRIRMASEQDKE